MDEDDMPTTKDTDQKVELQVGHDDRDGEAHQPKTLTTPVKPSIEEIRNHELTHIPYRAWCEHSVGSRAIEDRHRRTDMEKEREAITVTVFAMDYMYLTEDATLMSADGVRQNKTELGRPILVEADRKIGGIFGHQVKHKGSSTKCVVKRIVDGINDCGHGGERTKLKSDQEVSMRGVMQQVISLRAAPTVPEHSPVGDPASNGMVENGCRRLQGMVRTLKSMVESKSGMKITSEHAIFPWLVEWVGQLMMRFSVGTDGKSPYERIRGRRLIKPTVAFGESVVYMPPHSNHRANPNVDNKMVPGIWLGFKWRTDERIIGTLDGVVKARTLRRRPIEDAWHKDNIAALTGTVEQLVPGRKSDHIPVDLTTPPGKDGVPAEDETRGQQQDDQENNAVTHVVIPTTVPDTEDRSTWRR